CSISVLHIILIAAMVLVFGSNIFIYEEWHTVVNKRALYYASTPRALADSMSLPFKFVAIGLYFGLFWMMWRLYKWITGAPIFPPKASRKAFLAFPVLAGLIFLCIRGGLGVIPINESEVYYSPHLFDNHAATNTAWSLIHNIIETTHSTENHYRFADDKAAKIDASALMGKNIGDGSSIYDWHENADSGRLNVVFIIMESMTAQVIEELGGEPGVCPNLSHLMREGVLFDNVYGSGYRTDQGIISVLAGYPAQPDQSIVLLPEKAAKLNSMSKTLGDEGYSTLFLYGGELTFANIGVWLTNQRFGKILSEKDFTPEDKTQRWGVDDDRVLQRSILEMNKLKQPFFTTVMTLSLHPPYDVPFQSRWQGLNDREKFLNSAAFADDAIGKFFNAAAQQPWYDHTLFVLVADHGVSPPNFYGLDNPKSRHIPMVIVGKPLPEKWRNKRVSAFGNHHDIAATVLNTMGLENKKKDFPWSRDLWWREGMTKGNLNQPADSLYEGGFAYYTNESGIGWVNRQGKGFYSFGNKEWYFWEGALDSLSRTQAKAYLQVFYDDYLQK
ncbi:MAG: LTA synthase family protein, partial [Saprospiraceae bacterium]|nr:LTA synthase family protein [Saprospiraceae bacterium]